MKKHIITETEYNAVKELSKQNTNKRVDKRLQVIILRYEGKKDVEIGAKLNYDRKRVSQLCAEFKLLGLAEYARHKYGGNNRNLSNESEEALFKQFHQEAEKGHIITPADIKTEYDKLIGKETVDTFIYKVLKRHNWRAVMPRSKHPNKASDEDIESSKKLTI